MTTSMNPQQNPVEPLDVALSIIEGALGRPVRPVDGEPNHRMAHFDSEQEARRAVARLRSTHAKVRRDEAGWLVVADVRVSPPLTVGGAFSATLRFPSAQFLPGGPTRITLVSEVAALGDVSPLLIFWSGWWTSPPRVVLVEAVVEAGDQTPGEHTGATRSLLDDSYETRESSIRFQYKQARDYQRFVRVGERVRVTLELPDLATAGLGAFLVDVQLEGILRAPGIADSFLTKV